MEIEKLKEEVSKIIKAELQGTDFTAFFFGSRITGTASPRSDLDVGIEGEEPLPHTILRAIKTRCEALPTLIGVDVIDFFNTDDTFKKVAKEKLEIIHGTITDMRSS